MRLILASTSPYRRALLERLAYPFECVKPELDEAPYKTQGLHPRALAQLLAREKARVVAQHHPGALVIGGDQVAALGEHVLSKPGSTEKAHAQLLQLAGKTHQLFTALHLLGPGIDLPLLETVSLTMRPLSESDVRRYVASDQPLDCAGSYKLELSGIKLFSEIIGGDHDAIVGMPLRALQEALLKLGWPLWPGP